MQERFHQLAVSGGELGEAEAQEIERRLEANPNDSRSRVMLVGFYFISADQSPQTSQRRIEHIAWVIKNLADDPIAGSPYATVFVDEDPAGYEQIKRLWLDAILEQPGSVEVLTNAASALFQSDLLLAKELAAQAAAIDASNVALAAVSRRIAAEEEHQPRQSIDLAARKGKTELG